MFTGIVRERGRVVSADRNGAGVHLRIAAAETAQAAPGDSISVSGCCLTVTKADGEALEFDAVPETIARTTLGALGPGDEVNVEVDLLAKYAERLAPA
jgi:riboflavin synthase